MGRLLVSGETNLTPFFRHDKISVFTLLYKRSMATFFLRNTRRGFSFSFFRKSRIEQSHVQVKSIMTTRPKLDKVIENLQKNPYFEKYSQKIAQLQQTSPEEFLQRVEEQEKKIREKKEKQERERSFQETKGKPSLEPAPHTTAAQLNKIMKIDMIQNKTKDEIIEIWREYHKQKDCVCGAMTPAQFEKMFERGKKYATFLLPLPREAGYEFILCQFYGTEVHMTPLLWYQTHKENAPECLTMIHYTELKDSKGIILMRGEFDKNSINVQEAQCLANELQLYYSTDDPKRLHLLDMFTTRPNEFKHMDLIKQLETISLEARNN